MDLSSIFTVSLFRSALETGCIYALVALALFISFSILNIADLTTDGCYTLGCAVGAMVTLSGHPFLALFAALFAGACAGFVTAFLQTRMGVESILAGIIVNTGLYTINIMVMKFSAVVNIFNYDTIFRIAKRTIGGEWYNVIVILIVVLVVALFLAWFLTGRYKVSGDQRSDRRYESDRAEHKTFKAGCIVERRGGYTNGLAGTTTACQRRSPRYHKVIM